MVAPYGYTDSSEVVATYILNLLKASANALGIDPQKGFLYGDSTLLASTPTLCVVPGPESTQYNGVGGRMVLTTFPTYVMVYYMQLRDVQANIHASMALANLVKSTVHADKTLGGNVIDCLSVGIEPGYALKAGALYDSARITFQSRSKYALNP